MLKAKLDSVRKNKKGFSLVELIIVIAIMVALIAVMAPSFVKYVQKSRDAAFTSACEDFFTALKTYYGDPDTDVAKLGTETIKISVGADKKLTIDTDGTGEIPGWDEIVTAAGVDTNKNMGSTKKTCEITVSKPEGKDYQFSMAYSEA